VNEANDTAIYIKNIRHRCAVYETDNTIDGCLCRLWPDSEK